MRAVLGALVGVFAMAGPALASGAGSMAYNWMWADFQEGNGIYYSTYAPDPNIGAGMYAMTHSRLYFNSAANHFNGVGFMSADSRSNRRLAYQISDAYGDFIYFVGNYTYSLYEPNGSRGVVSAGTWQNGGTSWHFNWWGPNGLNVGINTYNTSGTRLPEKASLGADAWGGCPSSYPSNYAWNWLYRNRHSGYWQYMQSTSQVSGGNMPTWAVFGGAAWGGSVNFGTVSCP